MALTRCQLPILLLVAMAATTSASFEYETKCYPPPTPTAHGGSAFRSNLLYLLHVLPSAAAPLGFASLQTAGRAASDRPLVRGFCFGDSAPKPCRRCLSDAGKTITEQCGVASRRASFWDERCFLGYADGTNASASAADDFAAVLFSGDAISSPDIVSVQRLVALAQSLAQEVAASYGSVATADATTPAGKDDDTAGNRKVRVLVQCARDRGAADCVSCLRAASLTMEKSWKVDGRAQGRVSAVLGSNCYLRIEISTPPLPLGKKIRKMIEENLILTVAIALLIVVIIAGTIAIACGR
ncbi:unnamed protein product [Alopecurus aequalis]